MRKTIWLLAGLLSAAAFADNAVAPVSNMKVDLQEVVTVGRVRPVDGVSSSGLPSKEALQVFRSNGYVAVIDLRGPGELEGDNEESEVLALGMDYVYLPVAGESAISFENAEKLDKLLDSFNGPVLVHCASGNRVGALMALRQSMKGADDDLALAVGKAAGLTGLEPVVRDRLAAKP